jgi:hypothetical protein
MEWLAVKFKGDDNYLFIQSRKERETSNSVMIDSGQLIETIVVKTFNDLQDALRYCQDINLINDLIEKM